MEKYLQDLTVLDLTRVLSGPFATMFLADMGANVIKVEPPQGDDTRQWGPPFIEAESSYFLSVNRNKRSIVIDLKTERGKQVLRELVKTADVVIENFKPGTLKKLGFGFEELQSLNPKIILASISGFGQTGKYKDVPGYDVIAQGMGGLMSVTGEPDGSPVKGGYSLADIGTGMWAVIGILTSVHNRDRTGEPQWIDASLLETMISWQTYLAGNYFATGTNPAPLGSRHPSICPYQSFAAKDGYFNLAVGNDKIWVDFCKVIKKEEWIDDERFRTNPKRVEHRDRLVPLLEGIFSEKSVDNWVKSFLEAKIPAGPIYNFSKLYQDDYVYERDMVVETHHPVAGKTKSVNTPIKYLHRSEQRHAQQQRPAPLLGQHTEEVLKEFGLLERHGDRSRN